MEAQLKLLSPINPPAEVVLTMSVTEAVALRDLMSYNVSIPDALGFLNRGKIYSFMDTVHSNVNRLLASRVENHSRPLD